jgi:hypothetical protein
MGRSEKIIIAMCCLASALSLAKDASDIGVVVDYSPPGAILYLDRAGLKLPVRIATVVQAGDKIQLPANSSVTVERADNQRLSSSGPGTWEVPAAPALGSIAPYFHRIALIMGPDYRLSASAITRGLDLCKRESIVVPVLPEGALVKAGPRGLSMAWTGGCPPFHLELKSDHGTLAVESGLASREFRFEQVSLDPGPYSVSITDRAGANATIPFAARSDGPAWPDTLATDTSHLGTVARALWLADIDRGVWRMDSVELLMPLRRQHDRLAEAVSQRILGQTSMDGTATE